MIERMTDQNMNMDFQSNLRNIFLTWRDYSRRNIRLANSLKTVMEKSLQAHAFEEIRQYALQNERDNVKRRALTKMRRMFWKANCGQAMSIWRQTEYLQTKEMIEITMEQTNAYQDEHNQVVRSIKKQNCDRSLKTTDKNKKAIWFQSWKKVAKWMKHKRVSEQALQEAMDSYAAKRLIMKWRSRTEATIKARGAMEKMEYRKQLIYKRAIYQAFMLKHHREKALILSLSNMAFKFDNRMKEAGFQAIQNYVLSKNDLFAKKKKVASSTLSSIMLKFFRRKLLSYFSRYRNQVQKDRIIDSKRRAIFNHWIVRDLKNAFNKWKNQAKCATTVMDVNLEGPIVEDVLNAQMDVGNMKNFMKKEGFTDRQIDEIANKGQDKGDSILKKAIGRWKVHSKDQDGYLQTKMFDRWRQYVHMRKIVKYWLNFIENRQQVVKSDLSHAFNKWKHTFSDKHRELQKLSYAELKRRAAMAGKV